MRIMKEVRKLAALAAGAASPATVVVSMTVFPFLPRWGGAAAFACVLATVVAWRRRDRPAARLGVFGSVFLGTVLLGSPYSQVSLALAIATFLVLIRSVPLLRGELSWLRVGTFGWDVRFLCLGSATLAAAALVAWFLLLRPDVTDLLERFVPDWPLAPLIVGGVLFAMLNAALEEVAYRGVMLDALRAYFGDAPAVVLQALAFGAIHFEGFPRGWIGVGLASFYGAVMGLVRLRSRGLGGPWVGHLLTDLAIVGILLLVS